MRRTLLFLSSAFAVALCASYSDGALAQQAPDKPAPGARASVAQALPVGHVARYRVTYMSSQTNTANRSATVVSITNQSAGNCSTSVDWRVGLGGWCAQPLSL